MAPGKVSLAAPHMGVVGGGNAGGGRVGRDKEERGLISRGPALRLFPTTLCQQLMHKSEYCNMSVTRLGLKGIRQPEQ